MTDPTDIVTRLRGLWQDNDCTSTLMDQAADEIERLRSERDEARREVCQLMRPDDYIEPFDGTVFEYATHRGWDCFKENTNG